MKGTKKMRAEEEKAARQDGDALEVVVKETPGKLAWNFEEIKDELAERVGVYRAIVYTDENIGDAKKDMAALRKLAKSVEDRRKEVKKRWMEPYAVLEKQAKELTAIIAEPVAILDEKVKEYEARQTEIRRAEIRTYLDSALAGLPDEVRDAVKATRYSPRWELKSTARKTWRGDIDRIAEDAEAAVAVIGGFEEEFREPCMRAYVATLDLRKAAEKRAEMAKLAERVREQERRRQEELRRQEEERRRQEELRRREEESRRQEESGRREEGQAASEPGKTEDAASPAPSWESAPESPDTVPDMPWPQDAGWDAPWLPDENWDAPWPPDTASDAAADAPQTQDAPGTAQAEPGPEEGPPESGLATLRVKGTPEQIDMVARYARLVGAECEMPG